MPCIHSVKALQDLVGVVEAQPKENSVRHKLLTLFLILPGSLALVAQGIVLLFILLIMDWLHREPKSKLASLRLGGERKGKARGEGFADSTRYAAISLRASPRNTRMR